MVVAIEHRMHRDRAVVRTIPRRRRRVRDCSRVGVFGLGESRRKGLVHPLDYSSHGTEIGGEIQAFGLHQADARFADLQEQSDFGLAEAIDGLHRIADEEERAAVGRLPACGERLEQFVLGDGRVLEFVDKQMLDACAHRKGQIGRLPTRVQGADGGLCDLGKIDDAGLGEHDPELRDR